MILLPYRRQQAVAYAHFWAYRRNPAYYNFDNVGGDCTNFASQCLLAGTGVMNFTPTFGWYYRSADDRAPAWSGVEYFYNFLTRNAPSPGPIAVTSDDLRLARPGDMIQLLFDGDVFQHTPVVVAADGSGDAGRIFVAAHSNDADCRPLDTYEYRQFRLLHITGYYA